jgi:hypothetical protein
MVFLGSFFIDVSVWFWTYWYDVLLDVFGLLLRPVVLFTFGDIDPEGFLLRVSYSLFVSLLVFALFRIIEKLKFFFVFPFVVDALLQLWSYFDEGFSYPHSYTLLVTLTFQLPFALYITSPRIGIEMGEFLLCHFSTQISLFMLTVLLHIAFFRHGPPADDTQAMCLHILSVVPLIRALIPQKKTCTKKECQDTKLSPQTHSLLS